MYDIERVNDEEAFAFLAGVLMYYGGAFEVPLKSVDNGTEMVMGISAETIDYLPKMKNSPEKYVKLKVHFKEPKRVDSE